MLWCAPPKTTTIFYVAPREEQTLFSCSKWQNVLIILISRSGYVAGCRQTDQRRLSRGSQEDAVEQIRGGQNLNIFLQCVSEKLHFLISIHVHSRGLNSLTFGVYSLYHSLLFLLLACTGLNFSCNFSWYNRVTHFL